jgi:hypothetical protein
MFYRVALQKVPSGLWRWESPVIASVEELVRLLGLYRSIPRSQLRVFVASSIEGLDLLLGREAKGLASSSIPVEHLLPGRWRTSHSLSQLELRHFESALRTCESVGMGASSTGGEPSLHEQRRSPPLEGKRDVLDRRRLEVECGAGGDHDLPYEFTLPTSMPQVLAWVKLLVRVRESDLQEVATSVGTGKAHP